MKRLPTATRHKVDASSTTWRIEFPSTPKRAGAIYFATTYPSDAFIYLTSFAQRPLSKKASARIMPKVKSAIDAAQSSELRFPIGVDVSANGVVFFSPPCAHFTLQVRSETGEYKDFCRVTDFSVRLPPATTDDPDTVQ